VVVSLGADPSRRANQALSSLYKGEPHADAADKRQGNRGISPPTYEHS